MNCQWLIANGQRASLFGFLVCYNLIMNVGHDNGRMGKEMEAIRVQQTVQKRGELLIRNLPVEKGQQVEVLLYC
jgi:hypothetical protein